MGIDWRTRGIAALALVTTPLASACIPGELTVAADAAGDAKLSADAPPDTRRDGGAASDVVTDSAVADAVVAESGAPCNPLFDGGCTESCQCPPHNACDPTTGLCAGSCAGGLTCNGGCCANGGYCVAGTNDNACGTTGGACAVCGGSTPSCTLGVCTAGCTPACTTGCCAGSMMCVAGTGAGACGSGGPCVDCVTAASGHACILGAFCACFGPGDCPPYRACDCGACVASCTGGLLCNGGCCSAGICQAGTAMNACGKDGHACAMCNHACVNGVCQ